MSPFFALSQDEPVELATEAGELVDPSDTEEWVSSDSETNTAAVLGESVESPAKSSVGRARVTETT